MKKKFQIIKIILLKDDGISFRFGVLLYGCIRRAFIDVWLREGTTSLKKDADSYHVWGLQDEHN